MMMIIYPAIDLYNNGVVRLCQGEYTRKTTYDFSPIELARNFIQQGAEWIHIVDLEGAEKGHPIHLPLVEKIVSEGIKVQVGGGLRSIQDIDLAFKTGASRVYVGSLLARDSLAAQKLYDCWGERIIPAVDIKDKGIAISGWQETVKEDPYFVLSALAAIGYKDMLITSVAKDGTFMGPDLTLYKNILQVIPLIRIIAAGGVTSIEDVLELRKAHCSGVVIGKSLYEARINLKRLLEVIR